MSKIANYELDLPLCVRGCDIKQQVINHPEGKDLTANVGAKQHTFVHLVDATPSIYGPPKSKLKEHHWLTHALTLIDIVNRNFKA